jgi:putative membrane protein
MPRLILIGATSLAALAFAACGDNSNDLATTTTPDTTMPDATASTVNPETALHDAQEFVNNAGQASLVEIRTSEMALQKSTNADVKAFAQMMIDQHKAAGEELKAAVAAAALAPPPETLDDFHMRRINDLTETDGDEDFDADYAALQVDAHNDAIRLFEDYSKKDGAVMQIKDFAMKTLPTLQTHKTEAERVRDAVTKAPDSKTPNPS